MGRQAGPNDYHGEKTGDTGIVPRSADDATAHPLAVVSWKTRKSMLCGITIVERSRHAVRGSATVAHQKLVPTEYACSYEHD